MKQLKTRKRDKAVLCGLLSILLVVTSVLGVAASAGDLNNDGVCDTVDARALLRHIVLGEPLTDGQLQAADANGDGVVNTQDIRDILAVLSQKTETTTTTTVPSEMITVHENEIRMFNLINEERDKEGLPPLRFAYEDMCCVRLRAAEQNIIFGHVRPNGERAKSVYLDFGMEIPTMGGENVCKYALSPEDAMDGFMESPGHKANILDSDYTAVSVGMDYTPEGLLIFVQLFKRD